MSTAVKIKMSPGSPGPSSCSKDKHLLGKPFTAQLFLSDHRKGDKNPVKPEEISRMMFCTILLSTVLLPGKRMSSWVVARVILSLSEPGER